MDKTKDKRALSKFQLFNIRVMLPHRIRKIRQENSKPDLKQLKQAPNCEINFRVWISFSLNFEYIKFQIFILAWVCLCVSESPAVVRKIIFTPLMSLTLSQRKMDIRNVKGWMVALCRAYVWGVSRGCRIWNVFTCISRCSFAFA